MSPELLQSALADAHRERDALARALDRAWGAVRAGLEADAYRAGKWDLAHAIEHRVHELTQQVEALRQERDEARSYLQRRNYHTNQCNGGDDCPCDCSQDVFEDLDRARAALRTAQQDAARLREALRRVERASRCGDPYTEIGRIARAALTAPADPTGGQ